MCHPEPAGGARTARCSRAEHARRRRTAKDLKMPGTWHVLSLFEILRRPPPPCLSERMHEYEWRLRQPQDDTSLKDCCHSHFIGAPAVSLLGMTDQSHPPLPARAPLTSSG